ncbi:hypothetical protein [Sinomicrobium soli]|uniref:hypothetical protein n=1 Tax=Sinomicrobium sp. N-1-3-6 TaxID=2219864 RepID=UPI000DCC6278|nr:hypothetical protein [Sinomicrobium sp. N-1-3-6]RAV31028.1 hypothetical protein DN748_01925 [Sinomicrobium sp. N-1-3-6]
MMKLLKYLAALLLFSVLICGLIAWYGMRDRNPGYTYDKKWETGVSTIRAGFAKKEINPEVPDSWKDLNGNGIYEPGLGERFEDGNNNGKFDAVYMAGFQQNRPATAIHDTLWARAMVLNSGGKQVGLVVLDAIGLFNDQVISIRKKVAEEIHLDYVAVISTHTHEAPDLIGLWGKSAYRSGVDKDYEQKVISAATAAIVEAAGKQEGAWVTFVQDTTDTLGYLVDDSRKPRVFDNGLRLMQWKRQKDSTVLGTIVAWANHPETLWNRNTRITSDFPHYVRQGIESGVYVKDSLAEAGTGGVAMYINGAIGGLMHTSPRFGIPGIAGDTLYKRASFDKAKAQGERIALHALKLLREGWTKHLEETSQLLISRSVTLPVANRNFRLAGATGLINRGFSGFFEMRSEIAYWQFGPAGFLFVPGEIYPELVNGGVEAPQGNDFCASEPSQTPPLRNLMTDQYKFVVGLSNDFIGYIIPKSQWDEHPPYLYNDRKSTYGEENSLGPETAPLLYQSFSGIIKETWK